MFKHKIQPFGKYHQHRLENALTGDKFSFVPGFGACLLDITFGGNQILDAYKTPEEMEINRWAKNTLLFPFPNRLKDGLFEWQSETYSFFLNDPGSGNALHGFGMDKPFVVDRVEVSETTATVVSVYDYPGNLYSFPFPFRFSFTMRLALPNIFEGLMMVENTGKAALPMGMGWHPYFRLGERIDDYYFKMPECRMIGVDERMIPTGKRYEYDEFKEPAKLGITVLDNCFALEEQEGRAEVTLEGENGIIHYWQETGAGKFNFMQVFTPPHRESLGIEPMSCNIDAFNNRQGLMVLEPEDSMQAEFGLLFEKMKR